MLKHNLRDTARKAFQNQVRLFQSKLQLGGWTNLRSTYLPSLERKKNHKRLCTKPNCIPDTQKLLFQTEVIRLRPNMKFSDRKVIFAVTAIITLVLFSIVTTVVAQSLFEVESIDLTVYRDGLIHVTQTIIVDELAPEVTLPLLSSSIENSIVLDENQIAVDYKISGVTLTVFTLGATRVLVEYDTIALTKKEAEVWTLIADNPYNLTVILPQNSTVIYLSKMPTAINTSGTGITLSLYPGNWEISYIVPLLPQDDLNGDNGALASIPIEYLIAAIVVVAAVVFSGLLFVRRRRGPNVEKILKAYPQLKKEDREVILFIAEKDGKAFEAEIRERFPDMPRTSLWRLVRRLERLEIVEVRKIGLENQVQLKK